MGTYEDSLARTQRKRNGIFYTPPWVIAEILDRTLDDGTGSILDPACGDGAFLKAARERAPHAALTGIDIDVNALKLARQRVPAGRFICGDALSGLCSDRKFDLVIGNPPYLNVDETFGRGHPRRAALAAEFPEIYRDKTDLAFYFLALAVRLARRCVGMITSRAFLEAYKADKLRGYLAGQTSIREIVDFGSRRVFPDAAIATCIIILDTTRAGSHGVIRRAPALEPAPIGQVGSAPWIIVPDRVRELNEKLDKAGTPVGDVLVVGQGMQTGRNRVFGQLTRTEVEAWSLPAALRRKRAANTDIQKGWIRDREEYLLYLEEVSTFDTLPDPVQRHLRRHERTLKSRAAYVRGNCEWWKYTWPLHQRLYMRRRILCPFLASSNRFAMDEHNQFLGLTDTTVLFDDGQPEALEYITLLLNSRLLTFRFRSIGKLKSNDIREYFWNSVSRLPIRRATGNPLTGITVEREVDEAVYQLYGLAAPDIDLVES